ncbi:hypothetical protein [Lactobacillus kalixensis]|uniref:Integral membrane protein n=1 Tax=Lactobacillus kalixensis DSM 16043 TaxID=1423763 RepID=A0A0R1U799_9LACO|nr:hypothetical protein [Lactobacillus kalixensis]KRL89097.1 integral membrane protein [Lactobacillus kalixensis DSM 16043]
MQSSLIYSLQTTLILIIIPAAMVLLTKRLSRVANQQLVNALGFNSQIYIGGLGIIIHELSHLLLAIIFRHKIDAVCLIRIPNRNNPSDTSLGYVKHSWNPKSFYQSIGNVFIGVAPVFGSLFIIFLILSKLDAPLVSVHNQIVQELFQHQNTSNIIVAARLIQLLLSIFQLQLDSLPVTILEILLVASVCFGGFDLSQADLSAAKSAFIALLLLVLIGSFLASLASFHIFSSAILVNSIVWIYLLFIIAIIILLTLNIIMWIIGRIF